MTAARFPAGPVDWFLILAVIALAVPAAVVLLVRSQRRCGACGKDYPNVRERAAHERLAHQI